VGTYHNEEQGTLELKTINGGLIIKVGRWSFTIGSAVEQDGERMIAVTGVPWSGYLQFRVSSSPKKLIWDAGQHKYEFVQVQTQ
jgi:hypothetical protein